MASRRTRIKGIAIANIPQRKRTVQTEDVPESDRTHSEEITNKESIIPVNQGVSDDHSNRLGSLDTIKNEENPVPVMKVTTEGIKVEKETENVDNSMKPTIESEYVDTSQNTATASVETDSKQNELPIKATPTPSAKFRRKFLKPGINLNAAKPRNISKNSDNTSFDGIKVSDVLKTDNEALSKEGNDSKSNNNVVILNEVRIPSSSTEDSNVISKPLPELPYNSPPSHSEVILNKACLSTNEVPPVNESSSLNSSSVKKLVPLVSDVEYPAAPPSPSKINRSRIKAIPKLSMRRTSCSASESEDEARKYGRIRNNSVCSVASTTGQELPTPTSPLKEAVIPKKINRTEQSRKLAEARKEFYKRFGTNMPDKQKLKMIDLIFYNPVTSPMSQKSSNKNNSDTNSKEKEDSEEQVDEPVVENNVQEKEKENDDDDNMLVPQIKIGPSGEIILDEQSLVVENAELAKQKEEIMNSRVIDGDFDNTGYGIYKRVPRTQAWSHKETLRFYKALNLIGTDFTMMTQLFPNRNRRELKKKFKREEKTNKHLIDKAIMQPCSYNFLDLKREMQIEFEEEALLKRLKEEELEAAKQNKALRERKRKIKKNNAAENFDGLINSEQDSHNDSDLPFKKRLLNLEIPKKSKPRTKKCLNIRRVIEDDGDDDADVSDMAQSDTDEEEFIPFLKPTRSGRMPKSTIKFNDSDDFVCPPKKRILKKIDDAKSVDSETKQGSTRKAKKSIRQQSPLRLSIGSSRTRRFSSTSSVESNSDRLVPGSVVVTTEEGLDGKTDYKVFMVTPEKKLTPLDLESDVIAKLVRDRQSAEFPLVTIPEKNVTIPASEEGGTENSNESAENGLNENTETTEKDKDNDKVKTVEDMKGVTEKDMGEGEKKVVVTGSENDIDKGEEKYVL